MYDTTVLEHEYLGVCLYCAKVAYQKARIPVYQHGYNCRLGSGPPLKFARYPLYAYPTGHISTRYDLSNM